MHTQKTNKQKYKTTKVEIVIYKQRTSNTKNIQPSNMRQKSPKISLSLFGTGCVLLGMDLPLNLINIPSETPLENNIFFFASRCQLQIISLLGWECVFTSPS